MSGADATPEDQRPERVIGSYRLVEPLGTGGMSSVFRAVHQESGVEVAVKILPRNLARNRTMLQRFLREAKSAEALEHPSIVAIYDHGVDDGQYYLVLEFVEGGDLHDWVRSSGPLEVSEAVAVIRSVAEGLRFAAGQGLVHRDIKPANLMRNPRGTVKIADLGLALQAEEEDERVTREGTTVGTVDYMSPEQAKDSRATSERSDIYSLGCTFFFLLTGQPPFSGGDISEKLSRHFTAPPPDPRDFRPDAPEALTVIVRKMMAKRPENRYANYDELIAALDAVPAANAFALTGSETLDALIVDDDDESIPAVDPTYTLASGQPSTAEPAPLYAILDDEDEAPPSPNDFRPLDLSEDEKPAEPAVQVSDLANVSMAELADLIGNEEPSPRRPRVERPQPLLVAAEPPPVSRSRALFNEEDEEALVGNMPGQMARHGEGMSDEERRWLKTLVLTGVGLLVAVIGFHQLYRATLTETTADAVAAEEPPPEPSPAPEPVAPDPPPPPVVRKKTVKVASVAPRSVAPPPPRPEPVAPPVPVAWSEPVDPIPPYVEEASYAPALESRYRPDWAAAEIPNRLPGKTHSVRRLPDPRDPDQKPSLAAALDVIGGGTVEISDDGPFFEDVLKVAGEVRLVRARPGFRPIICLLGPKLAIAPQQAGFIDLDSRTLILDGLDLIVDAKDLPRSFVSLFILRGGSLTLHNCTVTVVNRGGLPISVIQTGPSDKPSRIRLEGTLIRGSFTSAVDLAAGSAGVVISRSVVVNGHGAAVTSSGAVTGDRQIDFTRSVIATRGAAVEMSDPPPGARGRAVMVRALGSTFAHLAAPTKTALLEWRGEGAGVNEMVAWQGDDNTFAGWSDWLAVGSSHAVRIGNLAAARSIWPGTDAGSRELLEVRPFPFAADHAVARSVRDLAPERLDVLGRVAVPSSLIHEKTIEPFPHPLVAGLTNAAGAPLTGPLTGLIPGPPNLGPRVPTLRPVLDPGGFRELTFSIEAGGPGDLGQFLGANFPPPGVVLRVTVTGTGTHPFTPVRIPEGLAVEVIVAPNPAGKTPSWTVTRSASGGALIEARGGRLTLSGVHLSRDGSNGLGHLIHVERGHLVLHRCHLIARGPFEPGGGGLIAFDAPGSEPMKPAATPRPFESHVDRPTCRISESVLITGGEVLSAEVGRGLLALSNSAIAGGSTVFNLRPGYVARHRLEADLWLDHCTLAGERTIVQVGPWRGADPGPDRPWLVSSHRSAFFGSYDRRSQESVLLRAEPDSIGHGSVFWQSAGDAFEVPHFAAPGDSAPLPNNRPDVVRQWADLWGHAHVHAPTGPHAPASTMTLWLVTRLLKPGDVQPGDLAIDPAYARDVSPRDYGVDLARLGIAPAPRTGRKR